MFVRYEDEKMQADFSSKCPTKVGFCHCHDSITELSSPTQLLILLPTWEWGRVLLWKTWASYQSQEKEEKHLHGAAGMLVLFRTSISELAVALQKLLGSEPL